MRLLERDAAYFTAAAEGRNPPIAIQSATARI
jgi:hypothetical protein